ncbi:MAG: uracil-DNA glycosylase family protein [Rikenellaceae bacterium]|nr:uracil-DNA glycosylase family protein [Rikenellaceae bacterium]
MEDIQKEVHPLDPFLPEGARMLMLGSFPPPRARWSMEFYYPNLQNDMWRIFGLVFFGDARYFLNQPEPGCPGPKPAFDRERIAAFLTDKGIALGDTARAVIRHKGNASDKFLEIVEPVDIGGLLTRLPECRYIVTTGDKATSTLASLTGAPEPPVGGYSEFLFAGRTLRHYRMPSSSRAYPLPIARKAETYAALMREAGLL